MEVLFYFFIGCYALLCAYLTSETAKNLYQNPKFFGYLSAFLLCFVYTPVAIFGTLIKLTRLFLT